MEFNQEIYDKIYKHLRHKLEHGDQEEFASLLSQHPELGIEIEKHQKAEQLVMDAYLLDVKQQTKRILKSKQQSAQLKKWLGGGSAVVLLPLGIAAYFHFSQPTQIPKAQPPIIFNQNTDTTKLKTQPNLTVVPTEKKELIKTAVQPQQELNKPTMPKPTMDLEKEAQLTYLKHLEQQRETLKTDAPVDQTVRPNEPKVQVTTPIENKGVVTEANVSRPNTPLQELLFDLVFDLRQQNTIEIPTGNVTSGRFKIINDAGATLYESDFGTDHKAVWNGSSHGPNIGSNKQFNVLIFNDQNQPSGLGKISVIY